MSGKDAHLYSQPRPKKKTSNAPIAGSNLAFTSALSSLISSSTTTTSSKRTKPSKASSKDDIFKTHNRNVKKRAAADVLAHEEAMSAARMDDDAWRRTKRKLEEKSRLYAAMKRGDVEDENELHMVDFDRKWAEGAGSGGEAESDEEDEDEEQVEYVDEFGRTRRGTRREAAREEQRKKWTSGEDDRFTARPKRPENVIYGDAVQSQAFNPDATIAEQMHELATKRDREETPPDALHYDATKEVRSKGTGFFQFSEDEETRQAQMRNLEEERRETERVRAEAQSRAEQRQMEIEKRRKVIQERREKMQADKFLNDLGVQLGKHEESQ